MNENEEITRAVEVCMAPHRYTCDECPYAGQYNCMEYLRDRVKEEVDIMSENGNPSIHDICRIKIFTQAYDTLTYLTVENEEERSITNG